MRMQEMFMYVPETQTVQPVWVYDPRDVGAMCEVDLSKMVTTKRYRKRMGRFDIENAWIDEELLYATRKQCEAAHQPQPQVVLKDFAVLRDAYDAPATAKYVESAIRNDGTVYRMDGDRKLTGSLIHSLVERFEAPPASNDRERPLDVGSYYRCGEGTVCSGEKLMELGRHYVQTGMPNVVVSTRALEAINRVKSHMQGKLLKPYKQRTPDALTIACYAAGIPVPKSEATPVLRDQKTYIDMLGEAKQANQLHDTPMIDGRLKADIEKARTQPWGVSLHHCNHCGCPISESESIFHQHRCYTCWDSAQPKPEWTDTILEAVKAKLFDQHSFVPGKYMLQYTDGKLLHANVGRNPGDKRIWWMLRNGKEQFDWSDIVDVTWRGNRVGTDYLSPPPATAFGGVGKRLISDTLHLHAHGRITEETADYLAERVMDELFTRIDAGKR
jgi:hypothetical protein